VVNFWEKKRLSLLPENGYVSAFKDNSMKKCTEYLLGGERKASSHLGKEKDSSRMRRSFDL